jgi:hypothetical protein
MSLLAQANVARMRYPLDDPRMANFRAQLAPINALADQSPGFVWRLQTDEGDASAIRAFDDPLILFNMSVWTSVAALSDYTYKSGHVQLLRGRAEWFAPTAGPSLVLWWIPAGHIPNVEEAKSRFDRLAGDGPSQDAFTFKTIFPPR